jgi:BTB/POZ domain
MYVIYSVKVIQEGFGKSLETFDIFLTESRASGQESRDSVLLTFSLKSRGLITFDKVSRMNESGHFPICAANSFRCSPNRSTRSQHSINSAGDERVLLCHNSDLNNFQDAMARSSSPALTESTEATDVETTRTRTEILWAELQQIQRAEMEALKRKSDELEHEQESMNALTRDGSDIVTINVGGEVTLQATRDTLCLAAPGSRFAALFSGRWEDHCVRDAQGRIFLDHDPELVRMIVNYMRIKRVENPAAPLDPPTAPEAKHQEWFCLLAHFGLTAFLTNPSSHFSPLDVSNLTIVQQARDMIIQRVGKAIELFSDGYGEYYHVACTPRLVPGTQSSWKVTINRLAGMIVMGLVGKTNPPSPGSSYLDCFGWGGGAHYARNAYVAGSSIPGAGGWTDFTEGECLYFCLANNKLTMFSVTKSKRFVIDEVPDGDKFIHFNVRRSHGTTVTLEPLDATEYAQLMAS